jgi:membrane-associated HD superfamily phosphohydrolase
MTRRNRRGRHIFRPPEIHSLEERIDRAELRERYKTYLSAHYLSLHITVVSVVLAAAGVAAASLITRHVGSHSELFLLWLLWIGSLAATCVAYGGPMVGAFALPAAIPAVSDLVLPLLIGITEFLLFTILVNQVTPAGLSLLVNTWLIIVATFSFVALLSIRRARHHYVAGVFEKIYSEDVAAVVRRYIWNLARDSCAAGIVMAVAAVGAGLRISDTIKWPNFVFPLTITALLLLGLRGHSETARMWRILLPNKLSKLPD